MRKMLGSVPLLDLPIVEFRAYRRALYAKWAADQSWREKLNGYRRKRWHENKKGNA